MSHKILTRLLRISFTPGQTAGYTISLLLGLVIMLTGVTFFWDINSISAGKGSGQNSLDRYAVVSKQTGNGLSGAMSDVVFTPAEIDSLRMENGVLSVGEFIRADFDVYARLSPQFGGISTALFLESVPDDFIDIEPRRFRYEPGKSSEIPIVIPLEYLSLYNLGFAPSRGLPRITPEIMAMVPIELSVSGNGRQQTFRARIVGCSERINTIAVPRKFIDEANIHFGKGENPGVSRLIVRTSPACDLEPYLKAHSLMVSTGIITDQRVYKIAMIGAGVVALVGSLIMLLSVGLLTLSLHLLLYKNRQVLHNLMLIGYLPRMLSRIYLCRTSVINAIIIVVSLAGVFFLRSLWVNAVTSLGLAIDDSLWRPCLVAFVIWVLITIINGMTISRNVKSAFRIR